AAAPAGTASGGPATSPHDTAAEAVRGGTAGAGSIGAGSIGAGSIGAGSTGAGSTGAGTARTGTTGPAVEGGPTAGSALGPTAGPANGPTSGLRAGLVPKVGPAAPTSPTTPTIPTTPGAVQPTATGPTAHVRTHPRAADQVTDPGRQELGHLESRVLPGAAALLGPTGPGATLMAPQPPVAQPPTGSSVVPQVMGEITAMMARADGTQRIRLRLSPESLGDVSVILTMRGGAVEVTLGASGAGRAALEQSTTELHRLLELAGARSTAVLVKELSLPGTASFAPNAPIGQEPGQGSQNPWGPGQGHSPQAGRHGDPAGSAHHRAPDDPGGTPPASTPPRADHHRTSLDVSI
ncbi:MAG: flagellar hook-length control protein FliK, partial [Candidatus Nanopelagicales bacterium]